MAGIALQLQTAPARAMPRAAGPAAAAERRPAREQQPSAPPVELRQTQSVYCGGRTSRARTAALAVTIAVHAAAAGLFLLSKNPAPINAALPDKPIFVRLITAPETKPLPPVEKVAKTEPQVRPLKPEQVVQPLVAGPPVVAMEAPQPVVTPPSPPLELRAITPPSPAPAPRSAVDATAASSSFHAQILARLQGQRHYPPAARARRQEGVVQLRFTMNRQGLILAQAVEKGSGFAALDREAMDTLRRAQPLPSIPADLTDPLDLLVSIDFSLSR